LLTIGALCAKLYADGADNLYRALLRSKPPALVIVRHFDSTPSLLKFGKMANNLMKSARYLQKVDPPEDNPDAQTTWKLIKYDDWKKLNPRISPEMGVVEVLAQKTSVSWATIGVDEDWEAAYQYETQDCIIRPRIVQRANASTIYSALERSPEAFKVENIKALADHSGCVIVADVPDNCPANKKLKHRLAQDF
jgi:hypothetical protein